MSILCLGGSFNPIHHGHLIGARSAAERLGLSSVTLIPSAQPPHKPNALDLTSAQTRVHMCRLATAGQVGFVVDDLETMRAGPSYTIDTVRLLAGRGFGKVSWLIGADMVRSLPTWREPQALLAEADFVVMARPGWSFEWEALPEPFRVLREKVVQAPLIDISSSEIRRRIHAGLPIDFLTPAPVAEYIRSTGLYLTRMPAK